MAFTTDLIDNRLTTYQDTEYGYIVTTVCPGVAPEVMASLRPEKGAIYPGDSGMTARRCLDTEWKSNMEQGKDALVIRWVLPVAYAVSPDNSTNYIEARGSRSWDDKPLQRTATRLYISDNNTNPVALGDAFYGDSGLQARRCNDRAAGEEITVGLWLHRVSYIGFYLYVGASAGANSYELRGSREETETAYFRTGTRLYLADNGVGTGIPDVGDFYTNTAGATDTGLLGRRCVNNADKSEVVPGYYVYTVEYKAFAALSGGAGPALTVEVNPKVYINKSVPIGIGIPAVTPAIGGLRTFIALASDAISVTDSISGTQFPGVTAGTYWTPLADDIEADWTPEGIVGLVRISAKYKREIRTDKRHIGYARITVTSLATARRITLDKDQEDITGNTNLSDLYQGTNQYECIKGDPVKYDGPCRVVLETAYTNAVWNGAGGVAAFCALKNQINQAAFFSFPAKTLVYIGPTCEQTYSSPFVMCNHTFLYTPEDWEHAIVSRLGHWAVEEVPIGKTVRKIRVFKRGQYLAPDGEELESPNPHDNGTGEYRLPYETASFAILEAGLTLWPD